MALQRKIYDALILGAGPAGLSAALALLRVKRTALVLGEGAFRNEGIEEMHNVLGHDKRHPLEFRQMGRENIEAYGDGGIEFAEGEAVRVRPLDLVQGRRGFEVEARDRRVWIGRKLILAMGSKDLYPDAEGFRENWPDNIYQCLFCDGRERSHLPIGMMGFPSPSHLSHVLMASNMSSGDSKVTVFTNGPVSTDKPMQEAVTAAERAGCRFEQRKVKKLSRLSKGETGLDVHLEDGEKVRLGFLFDRPPTAIAGEEMLVDGLGVEIERNWMGSVIKRVGEPFGETNVKGCFVAGDAGTNMKAVAVAMAQGGLAAAGAVLQLCAEQAEELLESVRREEVRDGVSAVGISA